MEDRIVQYPNRIRLVPVDGQPNTYDIEEVPVDAAREITSEGTPLSKATLLTDVTGERYGLGPDGTIAEAFAYSVRSFDVQIATTDWSASADSNGWFTCQKDIAEMKSVYEPYLGLVITSAEVAEDERSNFGLILECETFDGYVIFKALDVPSMNLNVRFTGV